MISCYDSTWIFKITKQIVGKYSVFSFPYVKVDLKVVSFLLRTDNVQV